MNEDRNKWLFKLLRRYIAVLTVLCLSVVLIILVTCRTQQNKDLTAYEAEKKQLIESYETTIRELRAMIPETVPEDEYKTEAEALARLIQGTIPNHADSSKEALCWLVINRTENAIFPDNVVDVIEQAGQFDTYSADAVITADNYRIAYSQLETWHRGDYRPIPPGFVYGVCTNNTVVLRDGWNENKSHKWEA